MSVYNNKIIALCCTYLMFLPSGGSALDLFNDEHVIWETGRNVFVKYAKQDDSRFGANDHPVELEAEAIGKALSALEFAGHEPGRSKKKEGAVFTDGQIRTLSEYLAKGLRAAKPGQDILFSLEKVSRRSFGLKASRLFVAGRAFYKDGRLNLIFGEHDRAGDEGFEAAYDPTHVGIVSFNFDHGARTTASRGFTKTVAEIQGVERKRINDGQRNDWLVLDLQKASDGADLRARTRREEELARKQRELRELTEQADADRREGTGRSQTAPVAEPVAVPAPAQAAAPASATVEAPSPAQTSIEERLTILNQLRDKDLINAEEYAKKRQDILDDL